MAAAGGADAPFGVSCTPAARLCQKRQKRLGGSFRVYSILIEEKVASCCRRRDLRAATTSDAYTGWAEPVAADRRAPSHPGQHSHIALLTT